MTLEYMLIKQEYLDRPTDPARFWPEPDEHVLGGRDLLRPEHGTWLGITKQGRIAVLTNYREEDTQAHPATGTRSRGAMVNAWLKQPPKSKETTKEFVDRLFGTGDMKGLKGVGGFSLVCGLLQKQSHGIEPLAVVSNRTPNADSTPWIASSVGETYGLSNSAYDYPWYKVSFGKSLLDRAVKKSVESGQSEEGLLDELFGILDTDTFPTLIPGQTQSSAMEHMCKSIFIPALQADLETPLPEKPSGTTSTLDRSTLPFYGTQKQTVILVRQDGRVLYIEKSLFDNDSQPIKETRRFEFTLEGWKG